MESTRTSTLEAKLGEGLDLAIENLLDYQNLLDYDGHHFDRLELEANLWDGFFGYVRVGLSLKSIAFYKRYKKECRTFQEYCEKYLHVSEGWAKKIMQATEVWINLAKAGFETLPNSVSQAIPLIKFNTGVDLDGNCSLWDKWQECLDYATATKQQMTSILVKKVVNHKEPAKKIAVDTEIWELIDEYAIKTGLSKKDVVRKAIESYINSPPPQDPEDSRKEEEWQKDLQDLVDEYDESDRPKGEVWEEGELPKEGEERKANLPTPDTLCHTPSTPNTPHTRHAPHQNLKKAQFPPACSRSKIFKTGYSNNSDRSPSMENLTHQYRFWFQQPG